MYSKWYKRTFSRTFQMYICMYNIFHIRRTFQFKEELRPRTSISFFFSQSCLMKPGNRAYVSSFSLRSLLSYHLHNTYILSRIWDTCDVLRRFRHSLIATPHTLPNIYTRLSNLNNRVIDFQAYVRQVAFT